MQPQSLPAIRALYIIHSSCSRHSENLERITRGATSINVPVLALFTGSHADYHKPSDTWDKIDAGAASRLLELVAAVTAIALSGSVWLTACLMPLAGAAFLTMQSAVNTGIQVTTPPHLRGRVMAAGTRQIADRGR